MFKFSSASGSTFSHSKAKWTNPFDQITLLHTILTINMISLEESFASAHYTSAALKMTIAWGNTEADS